MGGSSCPAAYRKLRRGLGGWAPLDCSGSFGQRGSQVGARVLKPRQESTGTRLLPTSPSTCTATSSQGGGGNLILVYWIGVAPQVPNLGEVADTYPLVAPCPLVAARPVPLLLHEW